MEELEEIKKLIKQDIEKFNELKIIQEQESDSIDKNRDNPSFLLVQVENYSKKIRSLFDERSEIFNKIEIVSTQYAEEKVKEFLSEEKEFMTDKEYKVIFDLECNNYRKNLLNNLFNDYYMEFKGE